MKGKTIIRLMVFLIATSFLLVTAFALRSLHTVAEKNKEEMTTVLASQIYDALNNELLTPLMVAKTMSHDFFLQQMLEEEDFPQDEMSKAATLSYLNSLCDGFGYNSAFVVSDKSREYYTQKGYNKTVSPETDSHDIWYSIFVNSGLEYDFDVDTDEVHNDQWTVFVNCRVENSDKEFLGVCGVGVNMASLQDILSQYEEKYNIKVNLIDKNGLVQVDTDSINIEKAVLEEAIASFNEDSEYTYMASDKGGYIVTKYVEKFDWYLVVANHANDVQDVYFTFILYVFLSFAVFVGVLCVALYVYLKKEHIKLETSAKLDDLTGLLSKRTLIDTVEDTLQSRSYHTVAFILLDMDHFKEVNDHLGHVAGDRAIRDAARKMREVFRQDDIIGRFGGDEFCILLKDVPENILQTRLMELRDNLRATYTSGGIAVQVTVSIGAVFISNEKEITYLELMNQSDSALYEAKQQGRDRYVIKKL